MLNNLLYVIYVKEDEKFDGEDKTLPSFQSIVDNEDESSRRIIFGVFLLFLEFQVKV